MKGSGAQLEALHSSLCPQGNKTPLPASPSCPGTQGPPTLFLSVLNSLLLLTHALCSPTSVPLPTLRVLPEFPSHQCSIPELEQAVPSWNSCSILSCQDLLLALGDSLLGEPPWTRNRTPSTWHHHATDSSLYAPPLCLAWCPGFYWRCMLIHCVN